ncbi:MAG TPA: ATP-dependent DNA ligase, partial [Gaiellaceae bacterium]|nr:ATP-dependent DNA ligase [Gaiellaceae bacterium]
MPGPDIPFPPMEAELVRELPAGEGWQYEPKWDGFRGVLENSGPELALWSRNERPLLRYFPELRPLGELLPPRSALDGEIVIARDGQLDFDAMQMRLHPAESRIRRLSAEIPAEYVVFDVLVWDGEPVWELPLEERRARVEALRDGGFRVSPATRDLAEARGWLDRFEALGLDGVVAKRLGVPYLPGSREGMVKVKEMKTADCVVVGIRWKGDRSAIATLLLGLYREDGGLDYVGSAAVAAKTRQEVAERVLPLLDESSDRRFSEPNRWGTGELEEAALRPELVVEVRYDKVQG